MSAQRRDDGWIELDEVATNFDFAVDEAIEAKLKTGHYLSGYSGWEFHATIWWDGTQFVGEPFRYHKAMPLHYGATVRELMNSISQQYGYD